MLSKLLLIPVVGIVSMVTMQSEEPPKLIKVGIIGCDTSHCAAFTKILNNPKNTGHLTNVRVVAAWPGGSPDLPDSIDRVPGYVAQLKKDFQVEIVESIPDLLSKVDAVLLESVDGRPHWQQAKLVLKTGKPIFIDKPLAGSLVDGIRIFKLAEERGTPVFSSSALRFTPNIKNARTNEKIGKVTGCIAFSPCSLNKFHPDLYWYGIHGVETLYTIMGTGCESVQRTTSPGTEVVTGLWKDGRIGTFRGIREGTAEFGALVFGAKGSVHTGNFTGYDPLVTEIAKFFRTREAAVTPAETLEMLAFMEAADQSKKLGGGSVKLEPIMIEAQKQAATEK
ncbi:MAG TPA: Gfo/Idh/MocA family oxidoreductase [Gemmatales bacterium]|nr:Gfo/Idh/MocA family oxidoreductase [Gemmatales bacterium]